uniref:28S ribosomal protein S36, mitochondrial n=1 Tax=Heliothis virescens TaxID=7102 RepID=A0A2A4IZB0_HELVI
MVRVTSVLARVPVIKFRKGGAGLVSRGTPSGQGSSQAADTGSSAAMRSTANMSTSSIPDIDLPRRYRRTPLTEEEIEHINGGGIV